MQGYLSDVTARWLLVELARTTLLVAVLGVAAWLVLRLARVRSPVLHRVCCVMVLLAGWTLVRWPVDVAWYEAPPVVVAAEVAEVEAEPEPESFTPPIDPKLLSPPPEFGAGMGAPLVVEPEAAVVAETLEAVQQPEPLAVIEAAPAWSFTWEQVAVAGWLGGVLTIVVLWAIGYGRFLWQMPRGWEGEPEWQAEFADACAEQGRAGRVEFRVTDDAGPLLCRLPRRTVLLVPRVMWSELDAVERRAILRHELEHLSRGDLWKSLAVRVLALPHWFNPVAWLAVRRFDDAAEWACDRAAMDEQPTAYAAMLLRLGELAGTRARFGSAMSNRPLTTRIRRLLTLNGTEDSAMKKACLISLLFVVAPLALVRVNLVAEEPTQEPPRDQAELAQETPQPAKDVGDGFLGFPTEEQMKAAAAESVPPAVPPSAAEPETPVKAAQRKMVEFAKKTYEANDAAYKAGTITLDQLFHWSTLWLSAELALAESREEQIAAAQRNLARLKVVEANIRRLYEQGSRGGEHNAMSAANYHVADAERRLAEIEAMPEPQARVPRPAGNDEMAVAAARAFEATQAAYNSGNATLEALISWSNRWLAADLELARSREEQLEATRAHFRRIRDMHRKIAAMYRSGSRGGEAQSMATADYYLADAERRVKEIEEMPQTARATPAPSTRAGQPAAERQQLIAPGQPSAFIPPLHAADGIMPRTPPLVTQAPVAGAPGFALAVHAPVAGAPGFAPAVQAQPAGKVKFGGKEYFVDDPELNKAIGAALESGTLEQILEAVNAVRRRGLSLNGSVSEVISTGFAAQLMQLLGHQDPAIRDRAEAVLWSIGAAKSELQQAMESDNPEIAKRARRLLEGTGPVGAAAQAANRSFALPQHIPAEGDKDSTSAKVGGRAAASPAAKFRTVDPYGPDRLLYDGKTFDEWVEKLEFELSPVKRREAVLAMGAFAAHGYGKQAIDVIFRVMRDHSIWKLDSAPEDLLEQTAIDEATKVPAAQRLPAIINALKSGNTNQRLFAIGVMPLDAAKGEIIPPLVAALDDMDAAVVGMARMQLAKVDHDNPQLIASLASGLASNDPQVVQIAVQIVRGGNARPFPTLLPKALALIDHDSPDIRDVAIRILTALSVGPEQPAYVEALEEIENGGGPQALNAVKVLDGKIGEQRLLQRMPTNSQPIDRRR